MFFDLDSLTASALLLVYYYVCYVPSPLLHMQLFCQNHRNNLRSLRRKPWKKSWLALEVVKNEFLGENQFIVLLGSEALGLCFRGVNSVGTRNLLWGIKNKLIFFSIYNFHIIYNNLKQYSKYYIQYSLKKLLKV